MVNYNQETQVIQIINSNSISLIYFNSKRIFIKEIYFNNQKLSQISKN